MKKFSFIFIFFWMLFIVSCQPEQIDGRLDEGDPDTREYVEVSAGLSESPVFAGSENADTKASLSNGVEVKRSGALLLVYRHANGVLDSYRWFTGAEVQAMQAGMQSYTVTAPKTSVDVFLLGNLVAIRKSDGVAVSLMEALGSSFPVMEAGTNGLETFTYRLDGGDINSAYRRETMAEALTTYGLPYIRIEKGVNLAGTNPPAQIPQGQATWLFSKVNLTIDHSLFDGGDAGKVGYFVNNSVYLRQGNVRLTPFSTASVKAEADADLTSATNLADYDAAMSNAGAGTYVFYVPENMQGTQAGITMAGKNKTNTAIDASRRNYGTYVEFSGSLSGAGGFSGDVTYQFYLGGNASTDFNLERGKKYDVRLGFTAGALFGEPVWKVNPSITDSRNFMLTADEANTSSLPEGQLVAVRANRPGAVYVYSFTSGSTVNTMKGRSVADPSWSPSDISDCAWTSDFMSATNIAADVPNRAWLTDRGIVPAWDSASGKVSFTVTDATKFNAHIGEEKVLTLKLLPDVNGKTVTLKVKLLANLSITWDASLTDNFLPGMKRTATIAGYAGELQYRASDAHMYKNQVASGDTGLITESYSSSQQTGNGSFPIWCFYCCKDNYTWSFDFHPLDAFNDGVDVSFSIRSRVPYIQVDQSRFYLEVSGKQELMTWRICGGGSSGAVAARSAFDDDAFALVYPMRFGFGEDGIEYPVTGEHAVYDPGDPNDYIGLSYKGTYNSDGYPDIYIYRKKIGTLYDMKAAKDVRIKNSFVYCMPACSNWNGRQGMFGSWSSLDVRFLPFVSASADLGFAAKYQDYTITEGSENFDEPYRSYGSTTITYSSEEKARFYCTDRSQFSLYAVPQNLDSVNYGEPSESVVISQTTDGGPVVVSFANDGTNLHSAGEHKVFASVTNKWSAETREVEIGSFDVYVHFIVAGVYNSFSDYRSTNGFVTYLEPDSYFGRTTFDREIGNVYVKLENTVSFDYNDSAVFHGGFYSNFTSAGSVSLSPCVANPGVYAMSYTTSCQLFACNFTANYPDEYPIENYTYMTRGDTGGPAALAKNTGAYADMVFTDKIVSPWYSTSMPIQYITRGELHDSDGNGYYVLHFLRDVCASSQGWMNVFYDYH